jgi:alkylhydroperoxidase family enzyme
MFKQYTIETAPENSKELLQNVFNKFGFVPNQDKILAVSPSIYQSYNQSFDLFLGKSTLSLLEGQIVLMTISFENNSSYCMALHSWGMEMTKVPNEIIDALRSGQKINNEKLEILRNFTKQMILKKGHIEKEELSDFLDAGFTQQNAVEIIGGIGSKTIANFTNILAKTPLDDSMKMYIWEKPL